MVQRMVEAVSALASTQVRTWLVARNAVPNVGDEAVAFSQTRAECRFTKDRLVPIRHPRPGWQAAAMDQIEVGRKKRSALAMSPARRRRRRRRCRGWAAVW